MLSENTSFILHDPNFSIIASSCAWDSPHKHCLLLIVRNFFRRNWTVGGWQTQLRSSRSYVKNFSPSSCEWYRYIKRWIVKKKRPLRYFVGLLHEPRLSTSEHALFLLIPHIPQRNLSNMKSEWSNTETRDWWHENINVGAFYTN